MQERFALRFESGERQGETVAIPRAGLSLGRRPGNSVQVVDASVSGRHAEIELQGDEVVLRDLGSTNGTRVGGERISERRLAHGDQVLLGNIKITFLDSELDDVVAIEPVVSAGATPGPAAEADDADDAEGAGEGVRRISAERVERSRSRSLVGLAGILAILAVGAAAWWWLGARSPRQSERSVRPVEPVAGNLLAKDFSFEDGRGGWEGDERSPASFEIDPGARRSGEVGLRAEVGGDAGEWAVTRSPAARVGSSRALTTRAWMRAEDGAQAVLGLQLESTQGGASPLVAWSTPLAAGEEGEVELALTAPASYDSARVLLLARVAGPGQAGLVDCDDVSLVAAAASGKPPSVDEFEFHALGAPARALCLVKIDRVLLTLELCEGPAGLPAPRSPLPLVVEGPRARLTPPPAGPGVARTLSLVVEPTLAAQGVASTAADGYRVHQTEFEREDVRALILGSGRDLVRVELGRPALVRGRPEGGGFLLEAELGPEGELGLQVSFREERVAAQDLAHDARRAHQEGRPGDALALWQRLLDEYPFEAALVTEAGEVRGRIVQDAQEQMRLVHIRLERARFFRLVDVYRRCRDGARTLAEDYAPSVVADEARELLATIEGELAVLERELDRAERDRLIAIERALRAQQAPRLADRVRERLEARFGALPGDGGGR